MFSLNKNFLKENFFHFGLFWLCAASFIAVIFPRALIFIPLLALLGFAFVAQWSQFKSDRAFKIFFAVVALSLAFLWGHSAFIADQSESIERVTKLSVILPLGGLFLFALKNSDLKLSLKYLDGLLIACALASTFLIIELLLNYPIYHFSRNTTISDNFSTAVYNRGIVTIVFLSLIAFFLHPQKFRVLTAICFAPIVIALFMAQSQSAQLIFFFILAFYFLFPWRFKVFWILLVGGILTAMLAMPFVVSYAFENLPGFFDEVYFFKEGYVGPRLEIWDYISQKIMDSPWIGHGLEFTKTYDAFNNPGRYTSNTSVLHPHNFILQIWIELGLVGILMAASLLSFAVYKIYNINNFQLKKITLSVLVGFLVVSSFSHGTWQSWWIGLMFISAGWIILYKDRLKP